MPETFEIAKTDPSQIFPEFGSELSYHQNPDSPLEDRFTHTFRKMKERYDLEITKEHYDAMNEAILEGKAHFCCRYKGTTRFEIWLLRFRKQDVIVGWDRRQATITTVLPKKYVPHYKRKAKRIEALDVLLKDYPNPKVAAIHHETVTIEGTCQSCGLEGKVVQGAKKGLFSETLICPDCKALMGMIMKDLTRASSVIAFIRREQDPRINPVHC